MRVTMNGDYNEAISKMLAATDPRQLQFAVSKALNDTAKDLQAEVQQNIPQRFTLRRQWIVQGIRIKPSSKAVLEAVVYSKDEFMGRQETGEDKTPKRDRNLAIPMSGARRTKSGVIKAADLPSALGQKQIVVANRSKGTRTVRGAGGAVWKQEIKGKTYLMRRRGSKVEVMYLLQPRAKIDRRLKLEEDGDRIVREMFPRRLQEAIEYATRTARQRA